MYFTLHSVLSYFKGFKQALFNVIFYPKFSQIMFVRCADALTFTKRIQYQSLHNQQDRWTNSCNSTDSRQWLFELVAPEHKTPNAWLVQSCSTESNAAFCAARPTTPSLFCSPSSVCHSLNFCFSMSWSFICFSRSICGTNSISQQW